MRLLLARSARVEVFGGGGGFDSTYGIIAMLYKKLHTLWLVMEKSTESFHLPTHQDDAI